MSGDGSVRLVVVYVLEGGSPVAHGLNFIPLENQLVCRVLQDDGRCRAWGNITHLALIVDGRGTTQVAVIVCLL